MALRVKLAVIERIEGIKIVQLSGLENGGNGAASLSDQVVSSALRYRTQAPMVDALLADLGLPAGGQAGGLLQVLQGPQGQQPSGAA